MSRGTLLFAAVMGALGGCAHIEVDRRVERGPTLRYFDRELVAEGGHSVKLEASWPRLVVSLSAHDACQTHKVEEFAEEVTTERSASTAGPALALGVTDTVLGGALYLARPAFSDEPNRTLIDQGGHYGPSNREIATGWAYGLLIVGLPALVVGIVEYSQVGDSVEVRKAEQVVSATQRLCNPRPVSGPVQLADGQGPRTPVKEAVQGQAVFLADELGGPVDRALFAGRTLPLDEVGLSLVEAFRACAQLSPLPTLEGLDLPQLRARLATARECQAVQGGPGAQEARLLEAELEQRGATVQEPGLPREGPRLESFEEAQAAYAPGLHFVGGGQDLPLLLEPDRLVGQAALVRGIIAQRVEPNIAVLEVGSTQVLLFVPPEVPWAFDFPAGTRVEVVAVVMGRQSLGPLTAPLMRAVWMRPSPAP